MGKKAIVKYLYDSKQVSTKIETKGFLGWKKYFIYKVYEITPHYNDFEYRCKFKEQISHIGKGIRNGTGEEVEIPMKSGKVAKYRLYAEDYNPIFDNTGQKNWYFNFIEYKNN